MKKLSTILLFACALTCVAAIFRFKEGAPSSFEIPSIYSPPLPFRIYQANVANGVTNYVFLREFATNEIRLKTAGPTNIYLVTFENGLPFGNYNFAATHATGGLESDYSDAVFPFQVRPEKPGNMKGVAQ